MDFAQDFSNVSRFKIKKIKLNKVSDKINSINIRNKNKVEKRINQSLRNLTHIMKIYVGNNILCLLASRTNSVQQRVDHTLF